MRQAKTNTYALGSSDTLIQSKDCFKIKITNRSSGTAVVAGMPIESGESETFDGLAADALFSEDMPVDLTDIRSNPPQVYVTRYFYPGKTCAV